MKNNGKINAEEGFQFICLLVILIDSFFRTGKSYFP